MVLRASASSATLASSAAALQEQVDEPVIGGSTCARRSDRRPATLPSAHAPRRGGRGARAVGVAVRSRSRPSCHCQRRARQARPPLCAAKSAGASVERLGAAPRARQLRLQPRATGAAARRPPAAPPRGRVQRLDRGEPYRRAPGCGQVGEAARASPRERRAAAASVASSARAASRWRARARGVRAPARSAARSPAARAARSSRAPRRPRTAPRASSLPRVLGGGRKRPRPAPPRAHGQARRRRYSRASPRKTTDERTSARPIL
jgi:hypothetical protein